MTTSSLASTTDGSTEIVTSSGLMFTSNQTTTNQLPVISQSSTSYITTYVFVPIGCIILVVLLAGLVIFLIRKSRLDRLRHHLMPLYNFDPAEEGEDWESELLEEGMDHRIVHGKMRVQTPSPHAEPKLAFNRL